MVHLQPDRAIVAQGVRKREAQRSGVWTAMQKDVLPNSAGGREHDGERQDGNGFHIRPQVVQNDVTTVLLLIFAYKGRVAGAREEATHARIWVSVTDLRCNA